MGLDTKPEIFNKTVHRNKIVYIHDSCRGKYRAKCFPPFYSTIFNCAGKIVYYCASLDARSRFRFRICSHQFVKSFQGKRCRPFDRRESLLRTTLSQHFLCTALLRHLRLDLRISSFSPSTVSAVTLFLSVPLF